MQRTTLFLDALVCAFIGDLLESVQVAWYSLKFNSFIVDDQVGEVKGMSMPWNRS